jgi:glycosyltransferase involved in cell wall biosynthesis
MAPIPLLLVSDSPAAPTGLGRITRELAVRIHENLGDTFRLATLGYGGNYSSRFKWPQYQISRLEAWSVPDLPRVWKDFAGDEKGIILTIWNPSWLPWLADPEKLAPGTLKDFLKTKPFERWGYFPVDAEGPNGKLPAEVEMVIKGFDRPLMYTQWASDLVENTCGLKVPHLPHGTDTNIFYPRDKREMRKTFLRTVNGLGEPKEGENPMLMADSVFLVGAIATNSARKDWNLCFEVCQELLRRGVNVGLWAHTNALSKHWNIMGLAKAYGMEGRIVPTVTELTDEQMAEAQCACDVTIMPSLGEGFGLPIFESLACGVPCIHIDYAGAAEFLPDEYKVKPVAFYGEGFYANRRPVSTPSDWADKIQAAYGTKAELPSKLTWENLWPRWKAWLEDGVNG